mmetsp:Transcript_6053/g.9598  ORF Transcript_6053/g.9598 Transcript_6053/m.9598 type:complete len:253 (+) Transcript_6053:542-1300(+)
MNRVPPHERCFGVTEHSTMQSLVPDMTGKGVSSKSDDDDYDVVIAMHTCGKGCIAYFGDVNAEDQMLWLVSSFVESRYPKLPVDCFSSNDDKTFSEIIQLKRDDNTLFKEGKLDEAITKCQLALEKFGPKLGSNGEQKDGRIAILSNLSLVLFKKKDFLQSESVVSQALEMEWGHSKCSYRRAMACFRISQSTPGGDLKRLRQAKKDVLNADISKSTRDLFLRLEAEIKKIEKEEQKRFSSGFAAGMAGKLA